MNESTPQWDKTVEVLVVGSGNGGFTAAIASYEMGSADVLVVEKADLVGGTSATSGGGIWIPCNHYAKEAGTQDTLEEAKEYLRHTLEGDDIPEELVHNYLENGPKMLRFLHDRTRVRYHSLEHYPDYYSNLPGSKPGHRSLEPAPINASELGDDYAHLMPVHHMMRLFGLINFTQEEAHMLTLRLPGWIKLAARMIFKYAIDIPWLLKSRMSRRLCCGSAGVARLFASLKDRNIPLWRNAPLEELLLDNGVVVGAIIRREGKRVRIKVTRGVILAAGGFEKNQQMRESYLPSPTNKEWSAGVDSNTGDAIKIGLKLGAATRLMNGAWWSTTLCVPGEKIPRLSIMEKSFPGSCVVNKRGLRFANESQNYMAFQKDLFKAHSADNPCEPAYQIFDARFRRNYLVGPLLSSSMRPDWALPKLWFDKGFVAKADTIPELAQKLGIDTQGLQGTIEKMNRYAKTGVDEDFHRGESAYDRYYADPAIKPNPCLAPIDHPPFYAMRIEPGDFGTQGGLATDIHARVLGIDGKPIRGLYAIGNCSAAILSTYPGPGSTLGPAMTMGYQAAKHINNYED